MSEQHGLKVLFLTSSYPRSREDTASVFLRYLAEHLADLGLEIHVLAPADTASGTTVEGKITVHRFQYFLSRFQRLAYGSGIMPNLKRSPWLWLQVPFFILAMAYSLLRVIRHEHIDLLHAHWILPQGLVGLLGSSIFRVPMVVTAHGTDAFALRSKIASYLKRLVIRRSKCWTTNTSATADAVARNSDLVQPRVIPMGVDITRFSNGDPVSLRRELSAGELLVLFVGRLIVNKGCHTLIEAISLLPASTRAKTTLWIIGDGDERRPLEEAATHLNIRDKVRFFGAVSHRYLPDFYSAADILVVPSVRVSAGEAEGQGVVILEGFAARACVLASRIGGISAAVTNNITGVLVEPNNPSALAEAMEGLLVNSELRQRLTSNAFAEVKDRYHWDQIAAEFARLYREASIHTAGRR